MPGTERLQEQIQERTLISKKDSWDKVDQEHKAENNKLLALLNNHQEQKRLKEERGFTLERLQEERGITLGDCKKVFQYAKLQYEKGLYLCKHGVSLYGVYRVGEVPVRVEGDPQ